MGEENKTRDPFRDMLTGLSPNQDAADEQRDGATREPNYERWLRVPEWHLNETMLLIAGIEPLGYIWRDAPHAWPDEAREIDRQYRSIIEMRVYRSGREFPLSSALMVALMVEEEFLIPVELQNAITKHFDKLNEVEQPDVTAPNEERVKYSKYGPHNGFARNYDAHPKTLTSLMELVYAMATSKQAINYDPHDESDKGRGYMKKIALAAADQGYEITERNMADYLKDAHKFMEMKKIENPEKYDKNKKTK